MTAFALSPDGRDGLAPPRAPGMGAGLALALVAHVLLVLALAWSVNWKTSEPEGVVAELWSALPQIAAPRAVETPPPPPVVAPQLTPTPPRPVPVVAPPPQVDAQIAIERAEKARKDEARRAEETKRAEAARKAEAVKKAEAERQADRLADEQAEKKRLAEEKRRDDSKQAAIREANLRRMMSQAGTSDEPTANGNAARTSGPSAGYAGRIKARIKPNIVLTGPLSGNPLATVEIRLAPDGTIVGRKLTKSSGSPVWDETVLRAIEKTEKLPQDIDGRVPPTMSIDFRPQE